MDYSRKRERNGVRHPIMWWGTAMLVVLMGSTLLLLPNTMSAMCSVIALTFILMIVVFVLDSQHIRRRLMGDAPVSDDAFLAAIRVDHAHQATAQLLRRLIAEQAGLPASAVTPRMDTRVLNDIMLPPGFDLVDLGFRLERQLNIKLSKKLLLPIFVCGPGSQDGPDHIGDWIERSTPIVHAAIADARLG
jgi:hypothetical protein